MQMSWVDSITRCGDEVQCNTFVNRHLGQLHAAVHTVYLQHTKISFEFRIRYGNLFTSPPPLPPSSRHTDTLL